MNILGLMLELQMCVLVKNPAIYECQVYHIIKNTNLLLFKSTTSFYLQ